LTNVEAFEVSAALHDGFNTSAGDADTTSYREVSEFEEVKGYAAKRSVRDGGATEGKVEVRK